MVDDEDDDDDREYDSGPYCLRHWSISYDCDSLCVCGHECRRHFDDGECRIDGCNCEAFADEPVPEEG